MAKEKRSFKCEIVSLIFSAYQRQRWEEEFLRLQRELVPKAMEIGVKSEEDVERLVLESR